MSNVIKPKRGSTVPTSSNLENGEIGINTSNQSLYYGTGDDVQQIKAENVTGVVGINHGGTGATSRTKALTALQAGGGTETDANIVEPGTYVLNTTTGSNLPSETGYYLLTVFRYDTSDLACGQIAINLGSNALYHRAYVTGVWREWEAAANSVVEKYSPYYGANTQTLTDLLMIDTGQSPGSNFDCSFGTDDASTLVNSPVIEGPFYAYRKVYQVYNKVNNFYNTVVELHEVYPQRGRTWKREYAPNTGWSDYWSYSFTNNDVIPIENGGTGATTAAGALAALGAMSERPMGIELGQNLHSSSNFGGYIDFHFNGSTADYTSRLIEADSGVIRDEGSFITAGSLQSFGGLWVSGRGFFVNSDVYGTSLPAAGTAGRVFFKKA